MVGGTELRQTRVLPQVAWPRVLDDNVFLHICNHGHRLRRHLEYLMESM